jgi:hypothetical protein
MIVVRPALSIKLQYKYRNLYSLLGSQFLYRERTLPSSTTSLLPSQMLSTDTTNLGLKAIVTRNEIGIRKKITIKTSKTYKTSKTSKINKTKLEYHCNSLKYTGLYVHTLMPNQSSFTKLQ